MPPSLSLPIRKSLPIVGQLTVNIFNIDIKHNELRQEIETNANENRIENILNGRQDNFRNL